MVSLRGVWIASILPLVFATAANASAPMTEPLPELVAVRCDTMQDIHASASARSAETGKPMMFMVGVDPATEDQVLIILTVGVDSALRIRFRDGCAVSSWTSAL